MRRWPAGLAVAGLALAACARQPEPPLPRGTYVFQHRFAEHPSLRSIEVKVVLEGRRIVVSNEQPGEVFPHGVLAAGELAWHAASRQWIIAGSPGDAQAAEAGACSDGPEVVDLEARIYWTC